MSTLLIANNCTVESGSFMGDQCSALKACYLFAEHTPGVDKIIMSVSPGNQLDFLWGKFVEKYDVELIYDDWNAGDWPARWTAWDRWRTEREIEGRKFDVYKEHYLRIHGMQRQTVLCGSERGLGRRNIYQYWWCGQEGCPDELPLSVDWFDDTLIHHPPHAPMRDVYVSPHAKTQGNAVFTFGFWADVVRRLVDAGVSVTVGWDAHLCPDLRDNPLYRQHWGTHEEWMEQVCRHKLVACGNTGTGWLAAACGVPMITMEPPNSQMPDHRYRECGLRNIVEVVSEPDAGYVSRRIAEQCYGDDPKRKARLRIADAVREAAPHSVNPPDKLRLLAEELLSVEHVGGIICDLGSYRGGSALLIRRLAVGRALNLFDTWDGTPYDDPLCHHKRGEWVASLEGCQQVVNDSHNLHCADLKMTHYHRGIFPDSAKAIKDYKMCFVYVDMDTYQSTRDAIKFFWPRMSVGGKMVFDDYNWGPCAGVKKAVDEMFTEETRKVVGHTCIIEKK